MIEPGQADQAGVASLRLDQALTIDSAASQKVALFKLLAANESLTLDLSAVERIDSAGIQLLLMLHQQAQQADKSLSMVDHSPRVIDALTRLGLDDELGCTATER